MRKIRAGICGYCGSSFETRATNAKYCPECRAKLFPKGIPITKKCISCGNEYETTRHNSKYCSYKCMRDFYHKFGENEVDFPHKRREILARDNHTCQKCGKTEDDGVKLLIHHDIDELITFCYSCHIRFHQEHPEFVYPHYSKNPTEIKTCLFCGEEFESSRPWSKFCSTKCRGAYHRQRFEEMLKSG